MWWRILLAAVGGLTGLAGLTLGGLYVLDWQRASFDPAPHLARAAEYDVRILRDSFGVPHIYGTRNADVAFGLAYAHAEDDFPTIAETVMLARGRMGELTGEAGARTDYLVRLFRVTERVAERYATDIPADVRAMLEAYAAGINLYAAENPSRVPAGLMPVTGQDVAAGFVFRTPFFYGFGRMLEDLTSSNGRPRPLAARSGTSLYPGMDGFEIGSNAAAVSPARTPDGATRLMVNSHQPWVGPVAWYEVRVKSQEGWDMAGGVFPGSPFILHGAGPALGWANTVNVVDLADIYVLTVNPDNPDQYWLDGAWRDFETGSADLTVRLWGPLLWTVSQPTYWSEFGPVLKLDHGTYALRFAGMDEVRQVVQYARLNLAQDFAAFEAALRLKALPNLNYLYADRTGRIAFWHYGTYPDRKAGLDWAKDLPGDRSDLIWRRYLPFERIPRIIDPASGFLINANSTPFLTTTGPDALRPEDFPPEMGLDMRRTNRALRYLRLLEADPSVTAEDFLAIKMDKTYEPDSAMGDVLREIAAADFSDDPLLQQAQALLAGWDRVASLDSTATALALMTATPVVLPEFEGKPRGDLRRHLRQSAEELMRHFGRLDVPWREVNLMRRGDRAVPLAGAFDTLRAVEYRLDKERRIMLNEDGTLRTTGGDSLILDASWDAEGRVTIQSIHNFGSAPLDASSPHHADQMDLFAAEGWKPVHLDEVALRPHVRREYRPGR